MQTLPFPGLKAKLLPNQQAFLDAHPDRGTVYQTAVTYVNPQWIDIGKDLTAMFTGAMQPEDVLVSIDKRRARPGQSGRRPGLEQLSQQGISTHEVRLPQPANCGLGSNTYFLGIT